MSKDYYSILGLNRNATDEEIKSQYRKLASQYHPDVNHDEDATLRMSEINEAYSVLKNPKKRADYDQYGSGYANSQASDNLNPYEQYSNYNPNSNQYAYYNGFVYRRGPSSFTRVILRMILFMIISYALLSFMWRGLTKGNENQDNMSSLTYAYNNDGTVYVSGDGYTYLYNGPQEVTIPLTFTYRNVTYDVTGIYREAFVNNKNLKTVTLSSKVSYIGPFAFYGCNNIETVYFKGTEEEFNNIKIEDGNAYFERAKVVFVQDIPSSN